MPVRSPRTATRAVLAGGLAAACLAGAATTASATPVRGVTPWSVLMCTYSDSTGPAPFTAQQVAAKFVNAGTGGAADYFTDQSYGTVTLGGSQVRGWYRSAMTLAQSQAAGTTRWQRIAGCIDAARNDPTRPYTAPAGHRTLVMLDKCVDSGSAGGAVLLDPCAPWLAFGTHEMGHVYGLDHSFSNDPNYRNAPWSQIGEYDDPWDMMSAMNVFTFEGAYTGSGPGFVADQRDRMGWVARSKILTFGAGGATDATVTLAPLDQPGAAGAQLVRVPYDPGNPRAYYTVELAVKRGWSRGIPATTVLIHKLRADGHPEVVRSLSIAGKPAAQLVDDRGADVRIQVLSTADTGATVRIHSGLAKRCLVGWVWREARPGDQVCVTGAVRAQTRADNAAAASRRQPGGGPYGPDTCRQGFVWREAYPGDHVCVTGATRAQAAADNAAAASRSNPARLVFGPNTCKAGLVWREADQRDYVCVTPAVRAQTRADNAAAASRRQPGGGPYGPDTCVQGFVWREAFPADHVCVTGTVRAQARTDNAATGRYAY